MAPKKRPLIERLMAHVRVEPDGCWIWTGGQRGNGYGSMCVDGRKEQAHRAAYEAIVGPIVGGLYLDHLCRNRLCVNPAHLEPVSNRENILRGESFIAKNARLTHCKNGHPLSGENARIRKTPHGIGRECRACERSRKAAK